MTDKKTGFIGLIILFVLSCDGPSGFNSAPDESSPYELNILDVRTEPDPVTKGGTLYLECYFEDDASESTLFLWEVDGLGKIDTVSASINFIVTLEPGEYSGIVTADDTLVNRAVDFEDFTFNVSN